MKETLYWISLSEIFGPASSSLWKLMSTCESAEEGYRRVSEGKFTLAAWEKNRFLCSSPEKSAEILKNCKQKGIEVTSQTENSIEKILLKKGWQVFIQNDILKKIYFLIKNILLYI